MAQHVAHYRLNGYCLVQSAFSRMEVAALRSEVQALREAKFGDSDDPRVVLEPSGDAVRSGKRCNELDFYLCFLQLFFFLFLVVVVGRDANAICCCGALLSHCFTHLIC